VLYFAVEEMEDMKNVKSLESLAMNAVPTNLMFALLRDHWEAPFAQMYLPDFLEIIENEESEKLSRSIPWDHPLARAMDLNVHKRRLKGKNDSLLSIERLVTETRFFIFDRQT